MPGAYVQQLSNVSCKRFPTPWPEQVVGGVGPVQLLWTPRKQQGCGKDDMFLKVIPFIEGLSRQKFNSDLEQGRWQSLASDQPPVPGIESEPCHYKLYDFREESSCY